MSDVKLSMAIKEENFAMFKRCIRKMLDSTFIVGEKDEALYSYISRESNRQDISDYLRLIGLDVFVDTNVKIAMLKPFESDEETVGLKRANVISFSAEQYHILLVLWEIYLENLGYNEENIITKGDLIDKLHAYEVNIEKRDLVQALKVFKKYDLINYDVKDNTEDSRITLYPSLQFGWDLAQFKVVSGEYMKNYSEEELDDDSGDEYMEDDR